MRLQALTMAGWLKAVILKRSCTDPMDPQLPEYLPEIPKTPSQSEICRSISGNAAQNNLSTFSLILSRL